MAIRRLYYGWWILASSIVIMYLAGTVLFGFSAYYPSFIATFGWKRAQVLFGNTILQWAFGLMGLVWGTVADKRGVRPVLAIGTGCVAVACLLFGRITALWELYAIDLLFGAGLSGMGYLSNQILLSRWFLSRRGLAIGALNSAGAIGGAVAPVLHTFLIVHLGWRSAMSLLDVFLWLLPFPPDSLRDQRTPFCRRVKRLRASTEVSSGRLEGFSASLSRTCFLGRDRIRVSCRRHGRHDAPGSDSLSA